MTNILILKTATDSILNNLFNDLKEKIEVKYCLIPSSLKDTFQQKYKNINFIDIHEEEFYDVSSLVLDEIKEKNFDEVYIPITNIRPTNYGNILRLINELSFKKIIFYNCNREKKIIRRKRKIEECLIKVYVNLIKLVYML